MFLYIFISFTLNALAPRTALPKIKTKKAKQPFSWYIQEGRNVATGLKNQPYNGKLDLSADLDIVHHVRFEDDDRLDSLHGVVIRVEPQESQSDLEKAIIIPNPPVHPFNAPDPKLEPAESDEETLYRAVKAGYLEGVKLGLKNIESVNIIDENDNNLLHVVASREKFLEDDITIVKLLVKAGVSSAQKNKEGLMPYELVAKKENAPLAEYLRIECITEESMENPNTVDENDNNLLHVIASGTEKFEDNIKIAERLIRAGVSLAQKNKEGLRPHELALKSGYTNLAEYLKTEFIEEVSSKSPYRSAVYLTNRGAFIRGTSDEAYFDIPDQNSKDFDTEGLLKRMKEEEKNKGQFKKETKKPLAREHVIFREPFFIQGLETINEELELGESFKEENLIEETKETSEEAKTFFPEARTALKTAKEERAKQKAGQASAFDDKISQIQTLTDGELTTRAGALNFTQAKKLTVRVKTQETVLSHQEEVLASNIVKEAEGGGLVVEVTLNQAIEDIAILADLEQEQYKTLLDFVILNEIVQAFHGIEKGDPSKAKFSPEELKKLEAGSQVTALLSLSAQQGGDQLTKIGGITQLLEKVIRAGKEYFYQPSGAEASAIPSVEEEVAGLNLIQSIAKNLVSVSDVQSSWETIEAKIAQDTKLQEDLTSAVQVVNKILSAA